MRGLSFNMNRLNWGLIALMSLAICQGSSIVEFEPVTATQSAENGKKQLDELIKRSSVPMSGGSCWKSALENLQSGCKMMTEDIQARMTFRFTSCFNEMLGLPVVMCEPTTPIQTCMKQLDASSMATFRDYFLHTQDMCYYLKQEIWQEQTNHAVNRLTDAASDVTLQMELQKKVQEQIYESQQQSLQVQSTLKKDNEDLYNTVVRVKDVFEDFSETAKEHRLLSTEIFDKLSKMQKLVSWIQGEMSLLDLIFFYFAAMIFGYFATATARTRSARFWLIILYMAAIYMERWVFTTFSDNGYSPEEVHALRWHVRKATAAIGCFLVIVAGATYRDLQSIHHDMLAHMNQTLEQVAGSVLDLQSRVKSLSNSDISQSNALEPAPNVENNTTGNHSSTDDDTWSNYSSDDSRDNLESELKDLLEDDAENVQPPALGTFGRLFQGQRKKKTSPFSGHTYNLRERSTTPNIEPPPAYQHESTTQFARIIKKRAPKTAQAYSAPPTHPNYFSSDDEN